MKGLNLRQEKIKQKHKICAGDITAPNKGHPACELNDCLQCDELEI